MTSVAGRVRGTLALLAAVQVLWLAVTSLLPGGAAASCLPSLGRLAVSGAQLAWWSLPGSCAEAAAGDARQLAVAALTAAVPALLTDLGMLSLGAGVWASAARLLGHVQRVVAMVVRALPEPTALPADRSLRIPAAVRGVVRVPAARTSTAPRRGPPGLLAA